LNSSTTPPGACPFALAALVSSSVSIKAPPADLVMPNHVSVPTFSHPYRRRVSAA